MDFFQLEEICESQAVMESFSNNYSQRMVQYISDTSIIIKRRSEIKPKFQINGEQSTGNLNIMTHIVHLTIETNIQNEQCGPKKNLE